MGKARGDDDRTAKLREVQAQQRRTERRGRALWIGGTTVVVAALIGGGVWAITSGRPAGTSSNGSEGLAAFSNLARDHVAGKVNYTQTPPVGGQHSVAWQNCGVYPTPVPNENAVHSLEHGAMWITYRPDLPTDQVSALRAAVKGQPYGLLSPYPGLPSPVVASAWGTQLKLPSASDPRLPAFISKYKAGDLAPEPRGECTGGIGTPQP